MIIRTSKCCYQVSIKYGMYSAWGSAWYTENVQLLFLWKLKILQHSKKLCGTWFVHNFKMEKKGGLDCIMMELTDLKDLIMTKREMITKSQVLAGLGFIMCWDPTMYSSCDPRCRPKIYVGKKCRIYVEWVLTMTFLWHKFSSVQFSCSVMSDSLQPHEPQLARPPCPSPTPGVHSDSRPSSQWCHPAISSFVVPFSSCPQSFPASGSFPMIQLFASGGQCTGVSALTSVLPMNTQDWSLLGWTGWISLQSKGLSRVFSSTTVQKHQFFGAQLSSQSNSHIHTWPLEKP